jgi:DNA helicase-2/ATP-dependent DNA helicase PcrA
LVDEFQDTNYLQFEIFNLLVNPKIKNVFVVGDPDQTIYTWRGAYPNIFMDFLTNFKDTKTFVLDTNYRSTKNILNVANNLIKHNELRISKNLTTPNPTGSNVIFFAGETSQIEVSYIAKQIKAIIKQKQYAYQDIAVLYRAKHLSRTIEQEFINDGIPYLIYGDIRFYQRKEIKDLVAYLKLICNPQDELSLKRIINVPSRGIGLKTIENIEKYAASQSISFYDALLKISNDEIPSGISKPTIKKFMVLMELIMQQTKDLPLVKKIEHIIDVIHYQEYLKTFDQFETR